MDPDTILATPSSSMSPPFASKLLVLNERESTKGITGEQTREKRIKRVHKGRQQDMVVRRSVFYSC